MKTHSMLANTATVRAILDGRQKEDRRPVTPRTCETCGDWARLDLSGAWADPGLWQESGAFVYGYLHAPQDDDYEGIFWRVYSRVAPGDLIWVRETYCSVSEVDIPPGRPRGPQSTKGSPARPDWLSYYVYRADGEMPLVQWHHVGDSDRVRWFPGTRMPKAAARLILRARRVWMERQGVTWLRCVAFEIASRSGWAGVGVDRERS